MYLSRLCNGALMTNENKIVDLQINCTWIQYILYIGRLVPNLHFTCKKTIVLRTQYNINVNNVIYHCK